MNKLACYYSVPLTSDAPINPHGEPNPMVLTGVSLIRNSLPPYEPPTTLGTGLRKGPRGIRFSMSEVPL